jgi:uncharacterized membrane protein
LSYLKVGFFWNNRQMLATERVDGKVPWASLISLMPFAILDDALTAASVA